MSDSAKTTLGVVLGAIVGLVIAAILAALLPDIIAGIIMLITGLVCLALVVHGEWRLRRMEEDPDDE